MMLTSASFEEVVHALKGAVEEMKLETKRVDTVKGVVELRRGINLWTFGDHIKVHLLAIHDTQVVHVESGVTDEGDIQVAMGMNHRRQERRLVKLMRDHLGKERCHLVP